MSHSGHNVGLYWLQLVNIYTQTLQSNAIWDEVIFQGQITHSFSTESNQEWIGHCCQCERSSLKFGQIKLISPRFQNGFKGVGPRPPSCISTPPHWTNLLTQPKQNIHFLKHKQWFSVSLKSKLCLFCASSMFVFVQFWNGSEQRNTVSLWLTK